MIKFKLVANGRELIGFGLSHENLKRLKDGDPILFPGHETGAPEYDFMIFSGETEATMQKIIEEKFGPIGPETTVTDRRPN